MFGCALPTSFQIFKCHPSGLFWGKLHAASRIDWAIPFNKGTPPPMDDFSVSVPGGIGTLGYLRILL